MRPQFKKLHEKVQSIEPRGPKLPRKSLFQCSAGTSTSASRRYWGAGRRRPHRLPLNAAITKLVWTHLSLTLLIIATALVSGWV